MATAVTHGSSCGAHAQVMTCDEIPRTTSQLMARMTAMRRDSRHPPAQVMAEKTTTAAR